MNTTIVKEALTRDIAIALSSTRWKVLFHLPTRLSLSKYGSTFLKDIEDPFYLIQFVHATMITLADDIEDSALFERFGNEYFRDEIISIFDLTDEEDNTPESEFSKLLLQLVDKIYNYFTTPYIGSEALKQSFLLSTNLEDTLYDISPDYKSEEDRQIISLMQVVVNQGDQTLSAFEDLDIDANWKHSILSHYNFEAIDYNSIEEAYPDAKLDKLSKLIERYKDTIFNDLDPNELPHMEIDLFDFEKLAEECLEDFLRRNRQAAGKVSKTNHKVEITIRNLETNETHTFESSDDCAKFLGIAKRTMVNFKKGKTKHNKKWQIVDKQESDCSV